MKNRTPSYSGRYFTRNAQKVNSRNRPRFMTRGGYRL
jgi:hypothetical protein